jgi:hypothetical protein
MLAPGLGTVRVVPLLFSLPLENSVSLCSCWPVVEADLKTELRVTRLWLDGFSKNRDCKCEVKPNDKVKQVVLLRVALNDRFLEITWERF